MYMKRMLACAVLGLAMLATSACALLPDNSVTADAKLGVQVALTTYSKVYQPALIAYGRLPACPQPTPLLCHDVAVFADLAAADAAVVASVKVAQQVMRGDVADTNNYLQAVMNAIEDAKLRIAMTGILTNKDK